MINAMTLILMLLIFLFLVGDVPRRPSYGVYISKRIRFVRVYSLVEYFNARYKCLTAKLLKQGCRYHKHRKAFSKFYRQRYEIISKFNVGLKPLLHQGQSESEFYGVLVYKFKNIIGKTDFSDPFRKLIIRQKLIGYDLNVMQQSACLVISPIAVDSFAASFNCTMVDQTSDYDDRNLKFFIFVGWDRSSIVCCLIHRGSTDDLLLFQISSGVVWQTRDLHLSRKTLYLLCPRLCFFVVLKRDLFVYRDDSMTCKRVTMRTTSETEDEVVHVKLA